MVQQDQNDRLVLAMRNANRSLTRRRSIRDAERTLGEIVAAAVDTIDAVDAASISLTQHGRVETRHPTTDVIGKLDEIQAQLREGPCFEAIDDPPENGMVVAQDLAGPDAQRWPRFAPHAVAAGYRSMLAVGLTMEGGLSAALNLYSHSPDAFGDYCTTLAGLFATQAALLLYGADHARHLQQAVDNRDVIGRAKGILMERFTVDDDTAFQMLAKSSQDTNMKLLAVAQWLATDQSHAARPDRDPR